MISPREASKSTNVEGVSAEKKRNLFLKEGGTMLLLDIISAFLTS